MQRVWAHLDEHRSFPRSYRDTPRYTRFNIQVPFTKTSAGDFDRLMEYTEVLRVEETREISLDEVKGL